jgi:hypothetical protein
MTDTHFQFKTIFNVNLKIFQGASFHKRWELYYKSDPSTNLFPLFSSAKQPLWKGRCMIREFVDDLVPLVSLTTLNGGVPLDYYVDDNGNINRVFYGLYMTAAQTATLNAKRLYYDIELERLTDNWVIRLQKGSITLDLEETR